MNGAALVVVGLSMMSAKPALKFIHYRRWVRETAAEACARRLAVEATLRALGGQSRDD